MTKSDKVRKAIKEKAFPLEDIVQRIESRDSWKDISLPQAKLIQLTDISRQAREILPTFRKGDFNRKSSRSKGLNLLFSGPSGSGKTLSASWLASRLGLPLYRVDLASVISKYIGETEKNLAELLSRAEGSEVILLFDEADSLFGKRTPASGSHERNTNSTAEYVFHWMKEYNGILIFTTNRRQGLGKTFIRRMHHIVEFILPENEKE